MEPAPRHQGSSLRGGPALFGFHLQLHHVSPFIVASASVPSRALERNEVELSYVRNPPNKLFASRRERGRHDNNVVLRSREVNVKLHD